MNETIKLGQTSQLAVDIFQELGCFVFVCVVVVFVFRFFVLHSFVRATFYTFLIISSSAARTVYICLFFYNKRITILCLITQTMLSYFGFADIVWGGDGREVLGGILRSMSTYFVCLVIQHKCVCVWGGGVHVYTLI